MVHCGDGSQRLFVLEREGIVRILNPDLEFIKEPFLDIHKLVQSGLKVGMCLTFGGEIFFFFFLMLGGASAAPVFTLGAAEPSVNV